jgi:hypothetical protein
MVYNPSGKPLMVEISDVLGRVVYRQAFANTSASLEVDTKNWGNGVYLVRTLHGSKQWDSQKLIVQRR